MFNERTESQEIPDSPIVLDLFSLSPEQQQYLSQRISLTCRGKIRVLVHPFWYWKTEKLQRYFPLLQKLLNSHSDKHIPLIVFEAHDTIDGTKARLAEMVKGGRPDQIYMVPTQSINPEPYFAESNFHDSSSVQQSGWPLVIEKFTQLGVKQIILGGQTLENQGGGIYDKCVAWAKRALESHFHINLSAISWPDRPIK